MLGPSHSEPASVFHLGVMVVMQVRLYKSGRRKEAHFWHQPPSVVADRYLEYLRNFPPLTSDEIRGGGDGGGGGPGTKSGTGGGTSGGGSRVIVGEHTPGYIWRLPYSCPRGPQSMGSLSI
jgi:hypothetical protein